MIFKAPLFLLLFLFVFSFCGLSQNKTDSLKSISKADYKHFKDSLYIVWEDFRIQEQKKEDSLHAIKRKTELEKLAHQNPDSLTQLKLSKLGLKEIPNITAFHLVKHIDLHYNKIKKITKKSWPKSDSLTSITLEHNQLEKVSFPKNYSIKSLNLSHNKLKRIPHSIRRLKSLRNIDLSHNEIKCIPGFIKRMDSLVEIKLNYNQLQKLTKRDVRRLKNMKFIHLGSNELQEIPDNIYLLRKANTLTFSRNHISSLPASFARLDSLEHLIFYRNDFQKIPKEIWALKKLKEIDFYYNNLQEIPDEIGSMINLQQIFFAFNEIEIIPDTIFSLKELKALYLHHNKIMLISNSISKLKSLLYLDLGYNALFETPDMSNMENLREIDLQENNLSEFPFELLENKNLTHIYLTGNSFVITAEERAELEILQEEMNKKGIRLYF